MRLGHGPLDRGPRADLQIALAVVGAVILRFADLAWASFLIVLVVLAAGWFVLAYVRDRTLEEGDATAS